MSKSLCGLVVIVDMSFSLFLQFNSRGDWYRTSQIFQVQTQPILTANLSPRLQHIRLKGISGLRELESRFSRKDTRFYNAVNNKINISSPNSSFSQKNDFLSLKKAGFTSYHNLLVHYQYITKICQCTLSYLLVAGTITALPKSTIIQVVPMTWYSKPRAGSYLIQYWKVQFQIYFLNIQASIQLSSYLALNVSWDHLLKLSYTLYTFSKS